MANLIKPTELATIHNQEAKEQRSRSVKKMAASPPSHFSETRASLYDQYFERTCERHFRLAESFPQRVLGHYHLHTHHFYALAPFILTHSHDGMLTKAIKYMKGALLDRI